MNDEYILDSLAKIYNINFNVSFIDFRKYKIEFYTNVYHEINFTYDVTLTFSANIQRLRKYIEVSILEGYYIDEE